MNISVLSGRSAGSVKAWLRLLAGYQPESIQRVGSLFSDVAGGVHSGYLRVSKTATQATATISFALVAAGDTVTIGSVVYTGTDGTPGATGFQTNVTPSVAADKVAAASLAAKINANTTSNQLVSAANVSGVATVQMTVLTPGTLGNFLPIAISNHGTITNGTPVVPSPLLTASTYAALAQSAVANTGNTVLNGDLGISPAAGTFITGFPPGIYSGQLHATDAAAAQAHIDATAAAVALQAVTPVTDISATDMGSATLTPGHYKASTTLTWTAGALTLSGKGVYIIEAGTSATLPVSASVVLTNGAVASDVYFITGTAFTFGATNTISGTILAGSVITTAASTVLTGRLLTYGVSGTSITFPSAAVISVPSIAGTFASGSEDTGVALYNGMRVPPGTGTI
jgi:hypothetical protein